MQKNLFAVATSTAPCVDGIRKAVKAWKAGGCKGVTPTTKKLLNYWFHTDHRLPNKRKFAYHYSQQEAVETLVFLYEVVKLRRQATLLPAYCPYHAELKFLQYDDFARYCVKMATGSGKTKVMSLAIAWQYLNAIREPGNDYASTFLLLAPNVIVYERLCADFGGNGRIFKIDPVIPPEFAFEWDLDVYLRDENERASATGALYVANIQQMHSRPDRKDAEPDIMTQMLGTPPPANKITVEPFRDRIIRRGGPVLVLNDEAHHTHDEKLKWNEVIRDLNYATYKPLPGHVFMPDEDPADFDGVEKEGVIQIDFTATPRYNKGNLFVWTVYDYPLKQAILDNIVKRPIKGVATGLQEQKSDIASVKYRAYLTAGVERWREYRKQLEPLRRKPLLFIMLNDTKEADEVESYLKEKYPDEFGGDGLLNIHTDRSGDISPKDLEKARDLARNADKNEVNAIVSVLMLREGWDVQNVTVVVGLRPYSSKANILPEQTIGRGLRLMFRDMGSAYTERVDIIGNKAFLEFVEQLEKEEEIKLETFEVGKDKLVIFTIEPDTAKAERDILLPQLSPVLARKKTLSEEIAALDVLNFPVNPLPMKQTEINPEDFHYEGYDFISREKLFDRDYQIPEAQTAQEVIGYYAKRIAEDVKLPSQFAALVPRVREFLERKAFGKCVDLESRELIRAISSNIVSHVTIREFVKALRPLVVEEKTPELVNTGRSLLQTPPFPFSRPTFRAAKTVFNLVAPDNAFEFKFAKFLQDAPDVVRFAKLPERFGFVIEYTDNAINLRYYEPDFVAVLENGEHILIETKGREDLDVRHKDRAAALWCENATALTGVSWRYIKVPQNEFESLQPEDFADLAALPAGNEFSF